MTMKWLSPKNIESINSNGSNLVVDLNGFSRVQAIKQFYEVNSNIDNNYYIY